jgi:hypothetical protein
LSILGEVPVEDIARAESSVLAEAITALRAGKVIRDAGYDGEYGVIKLFEDGELKRLRRHAVRGAGGAARYLPESARLRAVAGPRRPPPRSRDRHSWQARRRSRPSSGRHPRALDRDQRRAAEITTAAAHPRRPGAGKTRTLTHRIAHLIASAASRRSTASRSPSRGARRARCASGWRSCSARAGESRSTPSIRSASRSCARTRSGRLQRDFRIASEEERIAMLRERWMSREQGRDAAARDLQGEAQPGPTTPRSPRPSRPTRSAMSARNWIDFDDCVGLALRALIRTELARSIANNSASSRSTNSRTSTSSSIA